MTARPTPSRASVTSPCSRRSSRSCCWGCYNASSGGPAFKDRRKEAVSVVQVRNELQVVAHLQRDVLLLQHFAGGDQGEIRVGGQEGLHDVLILLVQYAARRIHQASALFQQAR